MVNPQPKISSIGHSTLSTSVEKEVSLPPAQKETIEFGSNVKLLSSTCEVVGTGLTMDGIVLHGHELPAGYVKVSIKKIKKNISPWPALKSDQCMLTSGSITAWPINYTQ